MVCKGKTGSLTRTFITTLGNNIYLSFERKTVATNFGSYGFIYAISTLRRRSETFRILFNNSKLFGSNYLIIANEGRIKGRIKNFLERRN